MASLWPFYTHLEFQEYFERLHKISVEVIAQDMPDGYKYIDWTLK